MTAAQSAGTTRFAIAFQFLTMATRSMVRRPPISSAAGPEVSVSAGSGSSGATAGGLAAAGEACRDLGATLGTTCSGAGEPDPRAADVFAGEAGLNLAFHWANVKGTSRNVQCNQRTARRPSYGGSDGGCNGNACVAH